MIRVEARPAARISANAIWLLLARVLSQALAVVATALIARRFGADGFGQFAWVSAAVFLGNVFTSFGTDSLLIRETAGARSADHALAPAVLRLQLGLTLGWVAVAGVVAAWQPSPATIALALYSLSLFPLALYTVFSAVLRGSERMDAFAVLNLAGALAQAACAVAATVAQLDLLGLFVVLLAGQCLVAAGSAALARRQLPLSRLFVRAPVGLRAVARAALPFALLAVLGILYQRAGVLLLPALAGDEATGLFAAAARVVEALKIVPQAVLGALFPLWAGGRGALRIGASSALLVGYGIVAAIACTLFAQPLIGLLFGERFTAAAFVLSLAAWSLPPYALGAALSLGLIARRREWAVTAGTVITLLVAFVLLAVLSPHAGAGGAAWALIGAETAQAAVFLVAWRWKR